MVSEHSLPRDVLDKALELVSQMLQKFQHEAQQTAKLDEPTPVEKPDLTLKITVEHSVGESQYDASADVEPLKLKTVLGTLSDNGFRADRDYYMDRKRRIRKGNPNPLLLSNVKVSANSCHRVLNVNKKELKKRHEYARKVKKT